MRPPGGNPPFALRPRKTSVLGPEEYDSAMATVQYESKDDAGHRFWTVRYGRYAIRIDANRASTGG